MQCDESKAQAFLWCTDLPGLGIRATKNEAAKSYIFQTKVNGKTMRSVIGTVKAWRIPDVQAEARRLEVIIDTGNDPRQLKADDEAAKKAAKQAKEARAIAP